LGTLGDPTPPDFDIEVHTVPSPFAEIQAKPTLLKALAYDEYDAEKMTLEELSSIIQAYLDDYADTEEPILVCTKIQANPVFLPLPSPITKILESLSPQPCYLPPHSQSSYSVPPLLSTLGV
jgi:hypothetical protein